MRSASILRKLREMDVPLEMAQQAAKDFGDENGIPTPVQAIQRVVLKAGRQKLIRQRQREIAAWCRVNGLPKPTFEVRFAWASLRRQWRWDIAWPAIDGSGGVAIDVQGGLHTRGAHVRAKGYLNDVEKREAGERAGWRVLYRTWQNLMTDDTANALKALLT